MIGSVPIAPSVSCPESFGVQVAFEADRAVVAVRGEMDAATVPTLRTVLDGLVGAGHHRVILDLDLVDFMGAAGLNALVVTRGQLHRLGGSLRLRSVPPAVTRLIQIAALDSSLDVEAPSDAAFGVAIAGAARGPTRDRATDARLSMVVTVAVATLRSADGASVTLQRRGALATVAATNDTVLRMDAHQYATGEGPCLSAANDGEIFLIDSLADDTRWPTFAPLASGEGIGSILSTPIHVGGRSAGALNIYSNTRRAFGTYHTQLAGILADHASRILAAETVIETSDDQMGTRIAAGLGSRLVLAQAQGVLMSERHVNADEATDVLHREARAADVSVLAFASRVVASTQARDA